VRGDPPFLAGAGGQVGQWALVGAVTQGIRGLHGQVVGRVRAEAGQFHAMFGGVDQIVAHHCAQRGRRAIADVVIAGFVRSPFHQGAGR